MKETSYFCPRCNKRDVLFNEAVSNRHLINLIIRPFQKQYKKDTGLFCKGCKISIIGLGGFNLID